MEKVIKTVYTAFYQKTSRVSYREQVLVTATTVAFILTIIIPFLGLLFL
tara:strand:+ start:320 stop:466 length:147 start_codon:yes stop_codon:yes gene_type:complete